MHIKSNDNSSWEKAQCNGCDWLDHTWLDSFLNYIKDDAK